MQVSSFCCDRCGAKTPDAGHGIPGEWIRISARADIVPGMDELDLCETCRDALRKWCEEKR